MKPIEFPESDTVYAEHQAEYLPLPCARKDDGSVIICWKLSWRERLAILASGVLWQTVKTFSQPLPPQLLQVQKPEAINSLRRSQLDDQLNQQVDNHVPQEGKAYVIPLGNLDRAQVLAALFNEAAPSRQASYVSRSDPHSMMTRADALHLLIKLSSSLKGSGELYIDTLAGRTIRCCFGNDYLDPKHYDETNGPLAAFNAIRPLIVIRDTQHTQDTQDTYGTPVTPEQAVLA